MTTETEEVAAIVAAIHPLLAGRGAAIQGAALADCLATWLAGHVILGDRQETAKLRRIVLDHHLRAVRDLLPIADAAIRERIMP